MIKLIQALNTVIFMVVAWSIMLAISIVIVGTTILGLSLTVLPYRFGVDLSVPPLISEIALVIYSLLMCFATVYLIYRMTLFLVGKLRDHEDYWTLLSGRKSKIQPYPVSEKLGKINALPTADYLAELASEDGEIPDTAYRKDDA